MSVTLKLADRDARLVASVLDGVADAHQDNEAGRTNHDQLARKVARTVQSWGGPIELRQVASAFTVAVRANEKRS